MKPLFLFVLVWFSAQLYAQNDCVDALVVCGDTSFNNVAVNGPGAVQEVNSCSGEESNSIWIKLNIATSGTLEFTVIPQNPDIQEDFDIYLYSFVTCDDRTIVRCSTTNPEAAGLTSNETGLSGSETDFSEGPGPDGNNFVAALDVLAGETYMLAIDRAVGNSNFSIIWTGTATFNQPPQFQLPTGITTLDISECDLDGIPDSSTAFDLTQNDSLIIGSQTDVVVSYYETESDSLLEMNEIATPNAYTNTSDPQTIYVRIENTITECFNVSQFEISISNQFSLAATKATICDDNADGNEFNGQATFNLQDVSAVVFPNFNNPGFTVNYYLSQLDADNNNSPLPQFFYNTVPNLQTIYIKIQNGICNSVLPVDLIVKSFTPVIGASLVQCDFGLNPDGITLFNLSEADVNFTNANPDYSVTYYLDNATLAANNALPNQCSNTSNPQNIIAKLKDNVTGCSILYSLTLNVNTTTAQVLAPLELCDIQRNGFVTFDLSQANVVLTPQQTASYYVTLQDALLEYNPLSSIVQYVNTVAFGSSVYVRVDDTVSGCSGISELALQVNRLPVIEATASNYLCVNIPGYQIPIDAGLLDSQPYTFRWYFETTLLPDTTYSINADQVGNYYVDIINAKGCVSRRTIAIVASDVPQIASVTTKGSGMYFNSAIINLLPSDSQTVVYSIDNPDGPYQDSNQFNTVPCGVHMAYATDGSGCGISSQAFEIIGIPVYFTPNGDGFEDTWNLRCASAHPNIVISLFDRFGKLLKEISAGGAGWDGTLNGKGLPADDYWYLIKFDNGRIEKGHFSLKR